MGVNPYRGQVEVHVGENEIVVIALDIDKLVQLEPHFPTKDFPDGNLLAWFESNVPPTAKQVREVMRLACLTEADWEKVKGLRITRQAIYASAVLIGAGTDPEGKAKEPGAEKANGSGASPGEDSKGSAAAH